MHVNFLQAPQIPIIFYLHIWRLQIDGEITPKATGEFHANHGR